MSGTGGGCKRRRQTEAKGRWGWRRRDSFSGYRGLLEKERERTLALCGSGCSATSRSRQGKAGGAALLITRFGSETTTPHSRPGAEVPTPHSRPRVSVYASGGRYSKRAAPPGQSGGAASRAACSVITVPTHEIARDRATCGEIGFERLRLKSPRALTMMQVLPLQSRVSAEPLTTHMHVYYYTVVYYCTTLQCV